MRASCPLCGSLEQVMLLHDGSGGEPPEEIVDCPTHGCVSVTDAHVEQVEAGAFINPDDPLPPVIGGLAETLAAAARVAAAHDWTDARPEEVAAAILTMRAVKDELTEAERRYTLALDGMLARGEVITVRGKDWRVSASANVRHDVERVCSVLAARVADEVVDADTGEVPPVAVIAEKVARATAAATGALTPSAKWRSGALKDHGIDLSDFETERSYGKASLREDFKR